MKSDAVKVIKDLFGENHVPSTTVLLHIAANQRQAESVKPEMFRIADAASGDPPTKPYCTGKDSLGKCYTDIPTQSSMFRGT